MASAEAPGSNVVDVFAQFHEWFGAALVAESLGERFEWAAGLVQMPVPTQVEGQMSWVSVIGVHVSTASAFLGESNYQTLQVPLIGFTPELVAQAARDTCAALRETRRRQSAELLARAQNGDPTGNGERPPAQGLIRP